MTLKNKHTHTKMTMQKDTNVVSAINALILALEIENFSIIYQ